MVKKVCYVITTYAMKIPKSFIIETTNFILRIPSEADFMPIFEATRHQGFNDGMAWEPPSSIAELAAPLQNNIKAWESGKAYAFTIEERTTKTFLGRISIRKTTENDVWNIGFFTHPNHQGKGIMTKVVKTILHFGFIQLKAIRIEAEYALWNKASERVLHKNGFKFVKRIEQGLFKNGQWIAENRVIINFQLPSIL